MRIAKPVPPTDSYQYAYCHNPDNYNFTSPGTSFSLDHIRPIAWENCYFTLFDQYRPSLPDFEIYPEDNIHTVILFETHPAQGQAPFCKLITLNGHPPEDEILLNMKGNIGEKLVIEAACQAPFDFYVYYHEHPKPASDYQHKQIVYFADGGVKVLEAGYWYRFKTFLQPEDYAAIYPDTYPSRVRTKENPFELKTIRLSINKLDQKINHGLCVACEHVWLKDFQVNVKWVWPDPIIEQAFVEP